MLKRRKWKRSIAVAAAAATVLVVLGLAIAYRAVCRVQPFYREAMSIDEDNLASASSALQSQAGALLSDVQRAGDWSAVFTADQLNGWLAVELSRKNPDLLPTNVGHPRVAISPSGLTIGFRSMRYAMSTVVSVEVDVFLAEPNVVAVRLIRARAGTLLLPIHKVAEEISRAGTSWSHPLCWTRMNGDWVALVDVDPRTHGYNERVTLDKIELHEGEIYVAGHTGQPVEKMAEFDRHVEPAAFEEDHATRQVPSTSPETVKRPLE